VLGTTFLVQFHPLVDLLSSLSLVQTIITTELKLLNFGAGFVVGVALKQKRHHERSVCSFVCEVLAKVTGVGKWGLVGLPRLYRWTSKSGKWF
jgi:hypothetical protein